jgi:hypothetical protein
MKTFGRTSAFIVDQDSVLDFDRRRRAQTGAQGVKKANRQRWRATDSWKRLPQAGYAL